MDVRTDKETRDRTIAPNPRSTAAIARHPIHPLLVPFPIAFYIGAFATDLVFMGTRNTGWLLASEWLLGAGLVMAAFAALAGLTDFLGERRIRDLTIAWLHAGGNVLAVLLAAFNFYIRYEAGAVAGLSSTALILSIAVVVILLFTGWFGGEMVFRHRVGVRERD